MAKQNLQALYAANLTKVKACELALRRTRGFNPDARMRTPSLQSSLERQDTAWFRAACAKFEAENPPTNRERNRYEFTMYLGWPGSPTHRTWGKARADKLAKLLGMNYRPTHDERKLYP